MAVVPMLVGSVLVSYAVFKFIQVVSQRLKFVSDLKWLPGPFALPLVGNAVQLLARSPERLFHLLHYWSKTFKEIYVVWIGHIPAVVVCNANILQTIMKSAENITKSLEYGFIRDFIGDGLLTSQGEKWHSRRKLLTPCFHLDLLENNLPMVLRNAKICASKIEQYSKTGEDFEIQTYVRRFALDVIMDTSIGKTINAQDNPATEYFDAINTMCDTIGLRTLSPLYKIDFFFNLSSYKKEQDKAAKVLRDFSLAAIKAKREERQKTQSNGNKVNGHQNGHSNHNGQSNGHSNGLSNGTNGHAGNGVDYTNGDLNKPKKRLALMDKLLELNENGAKLSDEDIREEVDVFVFAGHDTTTMAISFTLFILGHHPEVQRKIVEELDEKVPDFLTKRLQLKDLNCLEYLEMAIKESLRIYPPVPMAGRELSEPVKTDEGVVPAGATVCLHIYNTHMNERYFPDPHKYDPERFRPDRKDERHTFAYIPFSAGSRNCIGQKFAMATLKIIVATIVKTYEIKSVLPRDQIILNGNAILGCKPGLKLKITPRA